MPVLLLLANIFSSFLAFASTSPINLEDRKLPHVIICGQVLHAAPNDSIQLLLLSDPIGREEKVLRQPLEPIHNTFIYELEIEEATACNLLFNLQLVRLYLEPGDTLFLNFESNEVLNTISFYGKGSVHNNYLIEIDRAFNLWNDNIVQYQMSIREPLDFRAFIDDQYTRKNAWATEFLKKHGGASADFLRFAALDLTYWRAYNLLRYPRIRSLSKGVKEVIADREQYYDFFSQVLISNPQALNNPNYFKFIELYAELALGWIRDGISLPIKPMATAQPQSDVLFLGDTPDDKIQFPFIKSGPLPYTGKMQTVKEQMFYQLISPDGRLRWCAAHAVILEQPSLYDAPIGKVALEIENTVQQTHAFSIWNNLVIYNTPGGTPKGFAQSGEKMEYLNQRTGDPFPYNHQGQEIYDQFLLVKTQNDSVGWICNAGVVLHVSFVMRKEIREELDPNAYTPFSNLDRLFNNQVLTYMLARDFFEQSPIYALDQVKEKVVLFKEINEYLPYNEFVEGVYQMVLRQHTNNEFVTVTAPVKFRQFDRTFSTYQLEDALENKRLEDIRWKRSNIMVAGTEAEQEQSAKQREPMISLVGKPAPPFKLQDLAGNTLTIDSFKGKTVVLDFWASWCTPCISQMERHKTWVATPNSALVVLYVSMDTDEARWRKYLRERPYPGVHLFDTWREVAGAYAMEAMPTTYIINPDGIITAQHLGSLTLEELKVLVQH